MKAMVKAEKKGDRQTVQAYANSLVLPDAEKWFRSVFGDDLGPQYEEASERSRGEVGVSAPDTIAAMIAKRRTDIRTVRLEDSCKSGETDREYYLLLRRTGTEPLYDVRFSGSGDGMQSLWAYFAHVDGGFRYIGNLQASDASLSRTSEGHDAAGSAAKPRLRLGGSVTAAKLVNEVRPEYPDDARMARIQGTVVFHAIIGRDGGVHALELISGPCILAEAARKAVAQWKYMPTMLQGEPVEVDTTIKVEFVLSQ